ncbi:MAG: hypothetical protein HQL80_03230 [Magnetococcales bacterium]|nr:hypothetical protein [Magnetococcales bacterium]
MAKTKVALHFWHHPIIALGKALTAIHGSGWEGSSGDTLPIGLFYTPKRCLFGRVSADGIIETPEDEGLDLCEVFEARIFNAVGELRWLQHSEGNTTGRAVFVTEEENTSPNGWQEGTSLFGLTPMPDAYLLWGTTTGWNRKKAWLQLATPRIGGLYVPIPSTVLPGENKRLRLLRREYLGCAEEQHGNMAVLEDRLLGVEELR